MRIALSVRVSLPAYPPLRKHALRGPTESRHISGMATYVIVEDGAFFLVKLGDENGRVAATFSNRLAAVAFIEKQQAKADGAPKNAGR